MNRSDLVPLIVPFLMLVLAPPVGCRCSGNTKGSPAAPVPSASASTSASGSGSASAAPSGSAVSSTPPDASADGAEPGTTVIVNNTTDTDTTVYVAFGSDSVIVPSSWSTFCNPSSSLACSFPQRAHSRRFFFLNGKYLNATFSFGTAVTCGVTKAEVNVNNPKWYDIADISLVDGFSNFILIDANGTKMIAHGKDQNEKAFGVYPLGCDLCVSNSVGTCGLPKGTKGCKGGTQYKPDVPCQYQGPNKGGGGKIEVALVVPVPA